MIGEQVTFDKISCFRNADTRFEAFGSCFEDSSGDLSDLVDLYLRLV